jgi:hypothetical protein
LSESSIRRRESDLDMGRRADQPRKQIVDLLTGRPGWRLEPRTTPGATPLWCFVDGGEVEFSVTAENDRVRLYVMATDKELVFADTEQLTTWLQTHRPGAMQEVPLRPDGKTRMRKLFEWE